MLNKNDGLPALLGFYFDEYYTDGTRHDEIAKKIVSNNPLYKIQFRNWNNTPWNPKFNETDFLIYVKGFIKIGNVYGDNVVSVRGKFLDLADNYDVIRLYQNHGWRLDLVPEFDNIY